MTLVFVHGAWHGGWCWDKLAEMLRPAGYDIHAPTLSGLGKKKAKLNKDVGLDTHIRDITSYIQRADLNEIILVGHSYGGMVVTGVADAMKDKIAHIVYLDAALPNNGQSMISYGGDKSNAEIAAAAARLAQMAPDGIGMIPLPAAAFGIPAGHPLHDWTENQLTPHPVKSWTDKIDLKNGGSNGLQRSYIHCVDPVLQHTNFPAIAAMAKASEDWGYYELQTGHDAMVTAPKEVAKIIQKIKPANTQVVL